jgi:uncharacterized membrane protein
MMSSSGATENHQKRLAIGILLAGVGLLILSVLDKSVLTRYVPMPPYVASWLQIYARFAGIFLVGVALLARPIVQSQLAGRLEGWLGVGLRSRLLLVGIVVTYVLLYSAFTSYRHYSFNSATYDLGIMDQTVWNTAQGRPFESSLVSAETQKDTFLAVHFQPLLGLLAPLYWIYPSVYWLLIFQSLCLGIGAIPLYHIARQETQSYLAAIVLVIAYCLFPPMGYANRFDFHPEIMAVPLLLAAWQAIISGKLTLASLWLGLALLAKDDLGLTVAMIGLVIAVSTKRIRFGLIWCTLGVAFSLAVLLVLVPMFRGGPPIALARYGWLGSTPLQMIGTILSRPTFVLAKIQELGWFHMAGQLFFPVALLPFGSPLHLLLVAPTLGYNLLADFLPQHTAYFQYIVPLIPTIFIATVYGISNFVRWSARLLQHTLPAWTQKDYRFFCLVALISAALFSFWYDNPIRDHGVVPAAWIQQSNAQAVREALPRVPDEVRVITTNQYGSQLSHRRLLDVYYVRPGDVSGVKTADAAFLNLLDTRDATPEGYRKLLVAFMQENFGVVYSNDGVIILQRNTGDRAALDRLLRE